MTRVSKPPNFVVNFYYYYSYITLLFSWALGIILFYTIFAHSKKLGNFKWFILNHSIWCLALETVWGLVKPLVLTPAAAGIQLGIFRHSSTFQTTFILSVISLVLWCNCVVGVCASVGSRYLLVFPSVLNRWFNLKVALFLIVIVQLMCYALIGYVVYPILTLDKTTIHQWATDYDLSLEAFFSEPTFIMIPPDYHKLADILTLVFFLVTHICGALVFFYFAYHIVYQPTAALTNKVSAVLGHQLATSDGPDFCLSFHSHNVFLYLHLPRNPSYRYLDDCSMVWLTNPLPH